MIDVVKFEANHFLDILPRMWDAEKDDLLGQDPEQVERIVTRLENHPSWTMFNGDVPVACFGVLVTKRKGEAWVYFTPEVRPIKAEFEKILSEYLLDVVVCWKLTSVECGVIRGYEHLMPWVKRLGFEQKRATKKEVRFELCLSSQV